MTLFDFILRLLLSSFLGFLIGLERQITGHTIGVKTNVLVCLGTTMFILYPLSINSNDTVRMGAQIVTGVGFLGSGIIFKNEIGIRGINTAATIWCTAAIGILSGSGNHNYAIIATIILTLSNILLQFLSRKIKVFNFFDDSENYYQISFTCLEKDEFNFRAGILKKIKSKDFLLIDLKGDQINEEKIQIKATLFSKGKKDNLLESFVRELGLEEGVSDIGWKLLENL
ncbi:MgtC/SapB family protein [Fusobacterium sp.]|uniref:MgtC/SapB family protein n=1 Tax=Fusobacterium sp. TaxID=68766 RepID=UPI00290090D4|nr:MgtC/SapB family protein [Fusobacterium sp.]MDU1912032.1 MgtC/SapB family protein [Fusobacterium sp.]